MTQWPLFHMLAFLSTATHTHAGMSTRLHAKVMQTVTYLQTLTDCLKCLSGSGSWMWTVGVPWRHFTSQPGGFISYNWMLWFQILSRSHEHNFSHLVGGNFPWHNGVGSWPSLNGLFSSWGGLSPLYYKQVRGDISEPHLWYGWKGSS